MSIGKVLPLVPRIASVIAKPGGEPLPELWRRWWTYCAPHDLHSPNSIKNYRRCEELSRSLPDFPGPDDIVVWLAALAPSCSAETLAQRRDILHRIYERALKAGWTTCNPVAIAPWKRAKRTQLNVPRNMAELWPRLARVASSARELAWWASLRFLALRLEESLALEVRHVVTTCEPWRVEVVQQRAHPNSMDVQPVKDDDRANRRLPVPVELREMLAPLLVAPAVQLRFGTRGMPRTERVVPFLFPFRQGDLNASLDRLRGVAPDLFPATRAWHQFRRARAWELRARGKTTRSISLYLGHSSELVTERYFGRMGGHDVDADLADDVPTRPVRFETVNVDGAHFTEDP